MYDYTSKYQLKTIFLLIRVAECSTTKFWKRNLISNEFEINERVVPVKSHGLGTVKFRYSQAKLHFILLLFTIPQSLLNKLLYSQKLFSDAWGNDWSLVRISTLDYCWTKKMTRMPQMRYTSLLNWNMRICLLHRNLSSTEQAIKRAYIVFNFTMRKFNNFGINKIINFLTSLFIYYFQKKNRYKNMINV